MEEEIGRITHYFSKIGVGVIEIDKGSLKLGDTIHIQGYTTDFYQKISSLQMEHKSAEKVSAGEAAGMKVDYDVRENDIVFLVTEI